MHFLGESESKQSGLFVDVCKSPKCPSAYRIGERFMCSSACAASTHLPSSDLLKD